MITRVYRYALGGLVFALGLPVLVAHAQETEVLEKFQQQDLLIQRQNQRIQRLEKALENLLQDPQEEAAPSEATIETKPYTEPGPSEAKESETAEGADPFAGKRAPKSFSELLLMYLWTYLTFSLA